MFDDNPFMSAPLTSGSPGPITVGKPRAAKPEVREVGGSLGIIDPTTGSFTPTYTPPEKPKEPGDPRNREFEAQSAGYYGRMVASHKAYGDGILARDPVSQTFYDIMPQNWRNTVNDPVQRAAYDYADDFIRAKLRKESGAVIGEDEMKNEYRMYFPVPGDTTEDLQRKTVMRQQAINGMAAAAGEAAQSVKIEDYRPLASFLENRGAGTEPEKAPALNGVELVGGRRAYTLDDLPPAPGRLPTEEEAGMPPEALLTPPKGQVFVRWSKPRDGVTTPVFGPPPERGDGSNGLLNRADATVRGIADSVTGGLASKAAALSDTVFRGGTFNENLIGQIAVDGNDDENLKGYRIGGQLAGGVLLPFGAGARTVGELAKVGGATGALYGAGSQNRLADVPLGALSGGIIGAAAGAGGGVLANAVGPRLTALSQRLRGRSANVADAAADEGVPLDLAAASAAEGVPVVRPMYDAGAAQTRARLLASKGGGKAILDGDAAVEDAIERRALGLSSGQAMEPENAGAAIQSAGRRYIAESRARPQRWFARAEAQAGGQRVNPEEGLAVVDQRLAELSENPTTNASEIAFFEGLRNDLAQSGGKSVAGLRQLRQDLRNRIDEKGLTKSRAETVALDAMAAIRNDVRREAPAAARAYEIGDRLWAERMETINDFVKPFLGKADQGLAGEEAFKRFRAMANGGDGRRLRGMWQHLDPNEAADVSATLVAPLGRDAVDGPFSAQRFLTQTKNLSTSALETMFGPAGARSVKNLRVLARALEQSRGVARPGAGPGRVWVADVAAVGGSSAAMGLGGAVLGGAATGMTGVALPLITLGVTRFLQNARARTLMSPRLTQFLPELVQASSKPQLRAATERLGRIMAREPAVANDVAPLHQMLTEALMPQRLAASETKPKQEDEGDQ